MISLEEKHQLVEKLRLIIQEANEHFIQHERLLPERTLSHELGHGRRTVREALDILEGEGLIFRKQGQGTFIRDVNTKTTSLKSLTNHTSPHDIIEVRLEIEPVLAGLSAVRATNNEIDQMKHFIQRAALASSPNEYEQWDSAFHSKIAESVRNRMYWGIFNLINSVRKEQYWISSRKRVFTEEVKREMVAQHELILEAIQSRNPGSAQETMRSHILTVNTRISDKI